MNQVRERAWQTDVDAWRQRAVRRFQILLGVVGAIFLVTELVALAGWDQRLQPVSIRELSANILFAIGFGCPLVLHLSSLPRWREMLATLAIGAVLALALHKVHQIVGV